jgi:hypothetical protein
MWFRHHRTYAFPITLIALTAALVVFVWQAVAPSGQQDGYILQEEVKPVTVAEYEQALQNVMDGFELGYGQKSSEEDRAIYVEAVLEKVLALRVPSERKDVHLQLAFSLHRLGQGLTTGEEETFITGWRELHEIFKTYPWMDSTAFSIAP